MKTLQKITLLAFAVLSAGAANAQAPKACMDCTPPTVTPPRQKPPMPGCLTGDCDGVKPNTETNVATAQLRGGHLNNSYVFQNGATQYACVEQIGGNGVHANTANLIQDSRNDAADYGNRGYQTQTYSSSGANSGRGNNVAYGAQYGDRNVIIQKQTGSGNLAVAYQGDWDKNVSYQEQEGRGNRAFSDQDGGTNNSFSMQIQKGTAGFAQNQDNYSNVTQTTKDKSWAATVQEGKNNAVTVYQH